MNIIHAEYNMYHNSVDINYYNGYLLRIDCGKAEDGLITTLNSQRMLDALAIDNPLEYARMYLNFGVQNWLNAADMDILILWYFAKPEVITDKSKDAAKWITASSLLSV